MLGPLRRSVRAGTRVPLGGKGSNSGRVWAVDIELSVEEGSTVERCVPVDGARAPRFLGRNSLKGFVDQETAVGRMVLRPST